jgi:hypothetical protein
MNNLPNCARKFLATRVLEALASLSLTVVLFALSLILLFFGTLAQIDGGNGSFPGTVTMDKAVRQLK